jgi:hypothetical protein
MAKAGSGEAKFEPEFGEIGTAQVAEFDPLQYVPDTFLRIQLRRVGG